MKMRASCRTWSGASPRQRHDDLLYKFKTSKQMLVLCGYSFRLFSVFDSNRLVIVVCPSAEPGGQT